jgi:hypothetical protein
MFYAVIVIAMDTDGPLGPPVLEQIRPDDMWADEKSETFGPILKSMAKCAHLDEFVMDTAMAATAPAEGNPRSKASLLVAHASAHVRRRKSREPHPGARGAAWKRSA